MAPISPGVQTTPLRKPKKVPPTATKKLHRYESFTKRVSRLKIDPVHALDKRHNEEADTNLAHSFFRVSLEEWSELNLSQTFTTFLNRVNPLCENLPQLLHHSDTIFDLLLQAIDKQDALALEPLLSLLAHLAHDLGHRFEACFSRTVHVVSKVAAAHEKAEVVEWCFTCLAWMFKYLSRLLVQDLRPLLDIMVPHLSNKKDYIVRFSAEALAFLLRKAALLYTKRKAPLVLATNHLFEQLTTHVPEESQNSFQVGIMSLYVESSRGLEGQLHTSAPNLVRCLLDTATAFIDQELIGSTVTGILIALIHETDSETFQPVLEIVLETCQRLTSTHEPQKTQRALELLHTVIGTRKGTRISPWGATIQTVFEVIGRSDRGDWDAIPFRQTCIGVVAGVFQYAPMDQLLPYSERLSGWLGGNLSNRDFLSFCTVCARLGKERFVDLVFPRFQQFVVNHWADDTMSLYYTLENFRDDDVTSKRSGSKDCISCPPELEAFSLQQLAALSTKPSLSIEEIAGQIHLSKTTRFARDPKHASKFQAIIHGLVENSLRESSNDLDLRRRVLLSWGFEAYLEFPAKNPQEDQSLISLALGAPSINYRLPSFLSAVNGLLERSTALEKLGNMDLENVCHCLVQNLLNASVGLKTESLKLLSSLAPGNVNIALSETIELMLEILETPYTPAEVRKLAMLLRRLPQRHTSLAANADLQDMVPLFCLGLLSQFHDTTRKDICTILAQIAEDPAVENSVLSIAIQWLQTPLSSVDLKQRSEPETIRSKSSSFECTSLSSVQEICVEVVNGYLNATSSFRHLIENTHELEISRAPSGCRALALQVLSSIPASVERRSRLIVPIFLSAPMNRAQLSPSTHSDTSISSHTLTSDIDDHEWTLSDRKTFLLMFSKFNNPRALFRTQEVYEKLLVLLGNGNLEIRKLALQSILKWKDPQVKAYEETLLSVLEEKKTNSDLARLLSTDEEHGVKSADRSTILPILLRLIFGLIVGRSGTAGSQEARRKAILRSLFRMDDAEITMFLNIALGRLREVRIAQPKSADRIFNQFAVPEDQQYGFLRLLLSVLETLQSQFSPYGQQVVEAVVFCIFESSLRQQASTDLSKHISSLSRNIRRVGLQCLVLLVDHCPDIDWAVYLPSIFANAISPRLDSFASETSQGISGFMRLFATWVHSHKLIRHLRDQDARLPGVLWQCLITGSAQLEVRVFILQEIVLPWLSLAEDTDVAPNIARKYLDFESDGLLAALIVNLEQTPPRDILAAITSILPRLATFTSSAESKKKMIQLLRNLLDRSEYKLTPDIKSKLVISIQGFLQSEGMEIDEQSRTSLWELISSLFNFFKDQTNRLVLCRVLELLAHNQEESLQASRYCLDLNAASADRLDEPDYEKRLSAFEAINSLPTRDNSAPLWLPIVYNLLFFVRTVEDFAIRSNSLAALKQFIIRAAASDSESLKNLLTKVVLPSAIKGSRDPSELMRADFVTIYGLLVQHLRDDEDLADMVVLLVGDDDEASFFSNILHIQQHRRLRAIRRMTVEVEKGGIKPSHIAEFFIPLLEMFAYDSSGDESAQGTKGQSIAAMSVLLQWVDWKNFKVLFRKYKNDISNPHGQKDTVKLLGHAADALLSACKQTTSEKATHLAKTIPPKSALENEIKKQFIPRLTELVHYKDETEISFRIPVAVTSIKLIKMLPADEIAPAAGPTILDIANILRSRVQESRDVARNTLAQIVVLLGPTSLQFVVKELRNALTRGYQLHVLSYTVHSILISLAPTVKSGELDYCVADLVAVAIDDIFGSVGQEKDNQDYISSMKEVKSNKSFDTMELVANSTSVSTLVKLVSPVQTILSGTLTTKQVRQVDEWLRRIGSGISQNPAASRRDLLVFAYQLIEAFYKQKGEIQHVHPRQHEKNRQRYLVQLSSGHKTTTGLTSPLLYKLARFALDLVRSTLQKHDDLLKAENIHGFLPIIGDTLIEAQEDVKISAMRLLSAIVRLPMPELEQNAALYVMEAVRIVQSSTSTNEEGAQAALKLIAAILRERKNVKVRELDVAELLHRIAPDIEEPDRQGVTFNFIRAVMARKIQVPEIYELVDKIGIMMITNHARGARDVARGVYVHFILEYPQSSSRWAKQQKFLLKNLEYEYPEGRHSVMEAINTLVQKLKGDVSEELTSSLFMPVLLRVANDENQTCRELAEVLLGQLFKSANRGQLKEFLEPMQSWLQQRQNLELQKISLQAYSILLTSGAVVADANVASLQNSLSKILVSMAKNDPEEWETLFQALVVLSKLVEIHPGLAFSQKHSKLFSTVWRFLDHPNGWIQSTIASLLDGFFKDCRPTSTSKIQLTCSHGLQMGVEDVLGVVKSSVRILRRLDCNAECSAQLIQNLLFLAQIIDGGRISMEVAVKKSVDGTTLEDDADSGNEGSNETMQISGVQYILDQMARVLRLELRFPKTSALLPKISAVQLLAAMIPSIAMEHLNNGTVQAILLPLQHITDTNTIAPRSADPTFAGTYQNLVEQAHEVMDVVRRRIGDSQYVKALTEVSKIVRHRREERRTKRRIERVAEPERAAREKRRKADRKKERKREIGRSHQKRRMEGGL
ncbi:uncharacterized protein A1O9_11789 [Exophiala aquamarina CBS 119918]|uniref:Uncharacterized protein n=1 Tax=Exophiala aquamarina CBS 119918 TaxID=1182545 RepID=A0A072NXK6_9EURO|nr:uncharacterized protein A1O9_11789 [Exophiala aquamarina CBS 119918]KEF52162.1 hypothetical protein A1O9_11789 [Exophiala aquamarina CBS 119918]